LIDEIAFALTVDGFEDEKARCLAGFTTAKAEVLKSTSRIGARVGVVAEGGAAAAAEGARRSGWCGV